MKPLALKDILVAIDGNARPSGANVIIQHAAKRPSGINDQTLYFHHSENQVPLEEIRAYRELVVVTDNPELFYPYRHDIVIVRVKSVKTAYWKFVNYYRSLFQIPVIAVTGTSGKTTTKDMIRHIVSTLGDVASTYRSYNTNNSDLKYLLNIDDMTKTAVFEVGVYSQGDITESCKHFRPTIRVLLNIGVYHLTGCKTPEGYRQAKAEIAYSMNPKTDVLILNMDDENVLKCGIADYGRTVFFGTSSKADFRAVKLKSVANGTEFTLIHEGISYDAYVPGLGEHNVYNALAALAAARFAGVSLEYGIRRLQKFRHMEHHLEMRSGPGGSTILDDNWNNTPPSMESAIRVLKQVGQRKRTIAVLGYMYNLGSSQYALEQYANMGRIVAEAEIDQLVIVGKEAKEIGWSAIRNGMDEDRVAFTRNGAEVGRLLSPYYSKDTIVLLKAPDNDVRL